MIWCIYRIALKLENAGHITLSKSLIIRIAWKFAIVIEYVYKKLGRHHQNHMRINILTTNRTFLSAFHFDFLHRQGRHCNVDKEGKDRTCFDIWHTPHISSHFEAFIFLGQVLSAQGPGHNSRCYLYSDTKSPQHKYPQIPYLRHFSLLSQGQPCPKKVEFSSGRN